MCEITKAPCADVHAIVTFFLGLVLLCPHQLVSLRLMTASPSCLCDHVDDDSHQATAAAAAAASSAASAAAATPAEQRHSNIGQAMPAAASLQSHAAQSMADRISAQAAHASTSGSGITGIFAPGMGSSPLQYAASQPDVTPPEVADANANDAQVRPAYPAVFSAAMEFVGNDAAASTAHYFRHEVRIKIFSVAAAQFDCCAGAKGVLSLKQARCRPATCNRA